MNISIENIEVYAKDKTTILSSVQTAAQTYNAKFSPIPLGDTGQLFFKIYFSCLQPLIKAISLPIFVNLENDYQFNAIDIALLTKYNTKIQDSNNLILSYSSSDGCIFVPFILANNVDLSLIANRATFRFYLADHIIPNSPDYILYINGYN